MCLQLYTQTDRETPHICGIHVDYCGHIFYFISFSPGKILRSKNYDSPNFIDKETMTLHSEDRLEAPAVQMLQLLIGEDIDNQSVFLHCSNFTHFDFGS